MFDVSLPVSFIPAMPLSIDEIVEETRELPPDARAALVEKIILAAHGGLDPKVDDAWKQVTRQRVAEIQSGQAKGTPVDEALAEVRKIVGL